MAKHAKHRRYIVLFFIWLMGTNFSEMWIKKRIICENEKCNWKCHLQNYSHHVPASIYQKTPRSPTKYTDCISVVSEYMWPYGRFISKTEIRVLIRCLGWCRVLVIEVMGGYTAGLYIYKYTYNMKHNTPKIFSNSIWHNHYIKTL